MNRVSAIGSKRDGLRMREAIDYARKTGAFAHVSNAALTGWFLGVAHIDMFGPHRHIRHFEAHSENIECGKCGGKKWFGRGRKRCPACSGLGTIVRNYKARTSFDCNRITGSMHRSWRALVDDAIGDGRDQYLTRLVSGQHRTITIRPDWLDDVVYPEHLSGSDLAAAKSALRQAFTCYEPAPRVRLNGQLFDFNDCSRRFDLSACLVRLALTFGCTCPVTGERVSRADVVCDEDDEWLCSSIHPLGFWVRSARGREDRRVYVSPLSATGKRAIRAAREKCRKALGRTDNDWILAEVMKTHMLRAAVAVGSVR